MNGCSPWWDSQCCVVASTGRSGHDWPDLNSLTGNSYHSVPRARHGGTGPSRTLSSTRGAASWTLSPALEACWWMSSTCLPAGITSPSSPECLTSSTSPSATCSPMASPPSRRSSSGATGHRKRRTVTARAARPTESGKLSGSLKRHGQLEGGTAYRQVRPTCGDSNCAARVCASLGLRRSHDNPRILRTRAPDTTWRTLFARPQLHAPSVQWCEG